MRPCSQRVAWVARLRVAVVRSAGDLRGVVQLDGVGHGLNLPASRGRLLGERQGALGVELGRLLGCECHCNRLHFGPSLKRVGDGCLHAHAIRAAQWVCPQCAGLNGVAGNIRRFVVAVERRSHFGTDFGTDFGTGLTRGNA